MYIHTNRIREAEEKKDKKYKEITSLTIFISHSNMMVQSVKNIFQK